MEKAGSGLSGIMGSLTVLMSRLPMCFFISLNSMPNTEIAILLWTSFTFSALSFFNVLSHKSLFLFLSCANEMLHFYPEDANTTGREIYSILGIPNLPSHSGSNLTLQS